MKLRQLYEGAHSRLSHILRADPIDSTDRLVAYRFYIAGHATPTWAVDLNGQHLANIAKDDTQWVHDNWSWTYRTRYSHNLPPDFQQVMTKENRKYLDSMLNQLTHAIKRAITARTADTVVLQIDPI